MLGDRAMPSTLDVDSSPPTKQGSPSMVSFEERTRLRRGGHDYDDDGFDEAKYHHLSTSSDRLSVNNNDVSRLRKGHVFGLKVEDSCLSTRTSSQPDLHTVSVEDGHVTVPKMCACSQEKLLDRLKSLSVSGLQSRGGEKTLLEVPSVGGVRRSENNDDDGDSNKDVMSTEEEVAEDELYRKRTSAITCRRANSAIHPVLTTGEMDTLNNLLLRQRSMSGPQLIGFSENLPRTPSVVISDHSDLTDPPSLNWEDLPSLWSRRVSDSSTCSTVSTLDVDYASARKSSDCSTCSVNTLSADEDDLCDHGKTRTKTTTKPSGWRKVRNIVQWTPFIQTYKKNKYAWVQLAGHQGNFKSGVEQGTIMKKLCPREEVCLQLLMKDRLRPYVPDYRGKIDGGEVDSSYICLQDLLADFCEPCVMDVKMGVRTYLEEELAKAKEKPKLRKDMYEKMMKVDSSAPTDEEHEMKAVTKPRYMVWRETISSTATQGFRIEGIRKADGTSSKDYKTTRTREQVMAAFRMFVDGYPNSSEKYVQRLKAINVTLESSEFFKTHELIGSSLLFVHDKNSANVWMIDFAKSLPLPADVSIDHHSPWKVGNHEDGYMTGVSNLIDLFGKLTEE